MRSRALTRIFATRVAIKPNYSVSYTRELTKTFGIAKRPEKNTSEGLLSDKAQKRIKNAASWLQFLSRGMLVYSKQLRRHTKCKLVFITLTLPSSGNRPDVFYVQHCLQPFLKWLQRQHGCYLYIWKAEVQGERYYTRGERCIHFHITTNRFIKYSRINNKWKQLLVENGIMESMKEYVRTEIRGVKNEKGFANYMAKYISKKETDPALKVNCKIWGCSHALSNIKITLGEDTHSEFHNTMREFTDNTSRGFKEMKHCTIYYTSLADKKKLPSELMEEIAKIRDSIGVKKKKLQAGRPNGALECPRPPDIPLMKWTQSCLFPS